MKTGGRDTDRELDTPEVGNQARTTGTQPEKCGVDVPVRVFAFGVRIGKLRVTLTAAPHAHQAKMAPDPLGRARRRGE